MPIYVYVCTECDQTFDSRSRVNQEEALCPNCGGKARRSHEIKQAPQVIFKGEGWAGKSRQ